MILPTASDFADLEARLRRRTALADYSVQVLRTDDLSPLVGLGVSRLADVLGLEHARLLALQPDGETFRILASGGTAPVNAEPDGTGPCRTAQQALTCGEPAFTTGAIAGGQAAGSRSLDCPVRSLMSLRLPSTDRLAAVIEAGSLEERRFSDDEVAFIRDMAGVIATILERQDGERRTREAAESREAESATKTMLMRELQHRMKNNLQVITSLINLQSRRSKKPDVASELDSLASRIEALRLVHEKLYAHGPFGRIYLAGYVRDLCANLVDFCGETLDGPVLAIDISADLAVNTDTAIPFGLFLNEFVSQSLKSVRDGGAVAVRIRMAELGSDRLSLGLEAEGHDTANGHAQTVGVNEVGFGHQLMEMMASQLEGQLTWRSPAALDLEFSV